MHIVLHFAHYATCIEAGVVVVVVWGKSCPKNTMYRIIVTFALMWTVYRRPVLAYLIQEPFRTDSKSFTGFHIVKQNKRQLTTSSNNFSTYALPFLRRTKCRRELQVYDPQCSDHNFLPLPYPIHKVLNSPLKPPAIPTHRHERGCAPLCRTRTTAMAAIHDIDCMLCQHCTTLSSTHLQPAPSITHYSNMRERGSMIVREGGRIIGDRRVAREGL